MYNSQGPYSQSAGPRRLSWLEYTVISNPNGVMLVLAKYGYMGWMAPQDMQELLEATQVLIERYGDQAVEDLIRVHPDYDIIRSMPAKKGGFSNFFNATDTEGSISPEKLFDKLDRRIFVAAGIFLLAYILID